MIATVFGPAIGLFVHRLKPTAEISDEDRGRGMQLVLADGLTSQAMETMAGGVFLTAFAVALNASNLTIGFLAAIPAIAQLMQIPGVVLVEHLRARELSPRIPHRGALHRCDQRLPRTKLLPGAGRRPRARGKYEAFSWPSREKAT